MTSEKKHLYGNRFTASGLLVLIGVALAITSHDFLAMRVDPPIYPGAGVTRTVKLSTYSQTIAGTDADTEVYFLKGSEPGGTVLLLGGTHPNEPAASLAAITIIENAVVKKGRLIVIPRANHSAFTHSEPLEGEPETYAIETPGGPRVFRCGSRRTNPIDQWPDPVMYVNASGQSLAGAEVRNLNRSYPGNEHGYLTERLAYAIVSLIKQEKVHMAIDLHEASPEYPVINTIVAHERALDIAVEASMLLEFEGMNIGVERSPKNLRGLSHREWGDATDTLALLMEASNPAQGRLRGRTDQTLIVTGKDKYYVRAAEHGLLFVPFTEAGHPIKERVGRHLQAFSTLIDVFNEHYPDRSVVATKIPSLDELLHNGVGAYLASPKS